MDIKTIDFTKLSEDLERQLVGVKTEPDLEMLKRDTSNVTFLPSKTA